MQIIKSKTKAMTIAAFLMLTISISIFALPTTDAHDPIWKVRTWCYVSVAPGIVGVGQNVLIAFWI